MELEHDATPSRLRRAGYYALGIRLPERYSEWVRRDIETRRTSLRLAFEWSYGSLVFIFFFALAGWFNSAMTGHPYRWSGTWIFGLAWVVSLIVGGIPSVQRWARRRKWESHVKMWQRDRALAAQHSGRRRTSA